MPPVVSIVGKSGSGKTTLLERLVAQLKKRGYTVGTIKHDVHGFEIDHPGKDSYRHFHAGADATVLAGPDKAAVIKRLARVLDVDEVVSTFLTDVDIVLTEGYKSADKPKIEVFRSTVHSDPLCTKADELVALVSDVELDLGVPRFAMDDIAGITGFVEETFLSKKQGR